MKPNGTRQLIANADEYDTTFIGTRNAPYAADYEETVGITDENRLMHTLTIGPTGVGKTTAMQHAALQDAYKGRGLTVINPKGSFVDDLLAKLPDRRLDDITYVNPTTDTVPAVNVLSPYIRPGMSRAERENQQELIVDDLVATFRRLSQGWGDRIEGTLKTLLRVHVTLNVDRDPGDQYTLEDVYDCLVDDDALRDRQDRVHDRILHQQLADIRDLSDSETEPLRRRFRDFLGNTVVRRWLTQPDSDIRFRDFIADNQILLVDIQKRELGETATALIGSLLLTKLWAAAQAQLHTDTTHYAYIDEIDTFSGDGSNFARVLSEAREFGLGFWLACQYFGQLSPDMREAVKQNCRSALVFTPDSNAEKSSLTGLLTGIDADTLDRLGEYQAILQQPGTGQEATVIETLPPWDADMDVAADRRAQLLGQYGRLAATQPAAQKGMSANAGGEQHAQLLETAYEYFESEDYHVTILQQDPGSDRPDAVAVNESTDETVHIEAERSTVDKPGRVLKNLRRATDNDATAAFVTTPALAPRLLQIVDDPVNRHDSGDGEDAASTYAYYQSEDGPVTDIDQLRDAPSEVYVVYDETLHRFTGSNETLCPEYDDEDLSTTEFGKACLYRDADDHCRRIDAPCVLYRSDRTDLKAQYRPAIADDTTDADADTAVEEGDG